MKFKYIYVISAALLVTGLILLLRFDLKAGLVEAQDAPIEVDDSNQKVDDSFKTTLKQLLRDKSDRKGNKIKIYDISKFGTNYLIANIIFTDHPSLKNQPILDEGSEESRSKLIAKQENGNWKVALKGTENYMNFLDEIPEQYISKISKQRFRKNASKSTSINLASVHTQTVNYKFPWEAGLTWYLTRDWHGSSCDKQCAVDFAPDTWNGVWNIIAAAHGTVSGFCSNNQAGTQVVYVIDDDGNEVGYWHLKRSTIVVSSGQELSQGSVLGSLYQEQGDNSQYSDACGAMDGTHLHLTLPFQFTPRQTPDMVIDGWKFKYPDCIKNIVNNNCGSGDSFTSTNSALGMCHPPSSGTWLIDENCWISGQINAPGRVTITNDAVFTLQSGARLNINFTSYALYVSLGSRVIIQPGAKIY